MANRVQLRHDGFNRVTLFREKDVSSARFCYECGNEEKTLYHYYWIPGDSRNYSHYDDLRRFCCVGCFENYYPS